MPSLSHRISVKRQTTAENFISLRILLCFVINSLLQHLHMSAPTPTSPINQQSTNHPKQRTNTIFQWSEFHAVIFVSSTVRIISTENISYGENTWKIFEERKNAHCIYEHEREKNNIYTVWLSFIQRQRQTQVLFSSVRRTHQRSNTLTDGAEC